MLITPHILLGLYLVTNYNPWIALPAAVISHILFDYFYPHWNPHLFTEVNKRGKLSFNTLNIIASNLVLASLFVLFFVFQVLPDTNKAVLLVSGALLSILPDLVEVPYYFLKNRHPLLVRFVTFEHLHQAKAPKVWGLSSQVFLILVCLWALLK